MAPVVWSEGAPKLVILNDASMKNALKEKSFNVFKLDPNPLMEAFFLVVAFFP